MATITHREPSRRPLQRILERAAASDDELTLAVRGPLELSRPFVCPTSTPLYYAPIYHALGDAARLRYNQLTAISFNELIAFFETTFAASVLSALAHRALRREDPELARGLAQFVAEEQRHTQWWRELTRLSVGDQSAPPFRVPRATRAVVRQVTRRPRLFPAVFWIMLALEERSIDISQRCLRMDPSKIEPSYREIYRRHLQHEVGHVYMDSLLIERYYANRSRALRALNARFLRGVVGAFLLPPIRGAARVIRQLVREIPELTPMQGVMLTQLRDAGDSPEYHAMMYSREVTPTTFSLFDRFPEMHAMSRVLKSYMPQ